MHDIIRHDIASAQDEQEVCWLYDLPLRWSDVSYLDECYSQCRLDRKRRHVTLRCAFAYRVALHLLTHLRFVHTIPLSTSPDTKVLMTWCSYHRKCVSE